MAKNEQTDEKLSKVFDLHGHFEYFHLPLVNYGFNHHQYNLDDGFSGPEPIERARQVKRLIKWYTTICSVQTLLR